VSIFVITYTFMFFCRPNWPWLFSLSSSSSNCQHQ